MGLYNNPINYIEFGVNVSSTTASYLMRIDQSGYIKTFTNPHVYGFSGSSNYVSNLSLTYKAGMISAASDGSIVISAPCTGKLKLSIYEIRGGAGRDGMSVELLLIY